MRYFVRGPDGRLFGPEDMPTLRDWARSDRLPPYATLIAEDTHAEATAADVLGDPQTWPPAAPGTLPCPNCGRFIAAATFCPHCGAGRRAPAGSGAAVGLTVLGCSTTVLLVLLVLGVIAVALVFGLLAVCNGMNNHPSS